jgi:hypothetical protein
MAVDRVSAESPTSLRRVSAESPTSLRRVSAESPPRLRLHLHLLGMQANSGKPVILCEGPSDLQFVTTMASLFGINVDDAQLLTTSSLCANDTLYELIPELLSLNPKEVQTRTLLDPGFRIAFPAGLHGNKFYWSYPSIESYLFLYYCRHQTASGTNTLTNSSSNSTNSLTTTTATTTTTITTTDTTVSPLNFLCDPNHQTIFAEQYLNCFHTQNQNNIPHIMFDNWSKAIEAAKKPKPTDTDFVAVVKVLHGHTWVERIHSCNNTGALITQLQGDVKQFLPELKQELIKLLTFDKQAAKSQESICSTIITQWPGGE